MNYSKSFNKILLQANLKHLELSRKETSNPLTINIRNKRSALSLPSQILYKERIKKISDIYKALSCDKALLNVTSKSKKKLLLTPQRRNIQSPYLPLSNHIPEKSGNKLKLTLQKTENSSLNNTRSNHSDSSYFELSIKLRILSDKLQELMKLKSNDNFKKQFRSLLSGNVDKENQTRCKEPKRGDLLTHCMSTLSKCYERNQMSSAQQINELTIKGRQLQQQMACLHVQINRSGIKCLLLQRNLQKQRQINKQLRNELILLKTNSRKSCQSVGLNTSFFKDAHNYHFDTKQPQHKEFERNDHPTVPQEDRVQFLCAELSKLHKAMNSQKRNHKQLIDVLVFLKKQGIDIETIYDNVINGRIYSSESEESGIKQSISNIHASEKRMYKKARKIRLNNSFEADQSIISSEQGLSFNYQQKSLSMEAYTVRREYKSNQILSNELKAKLNLNLSQFYENGQYEQQFEQQQQLQQQQQQQQSQSSIQEIASQTNACGD